MLRDAIQSDRQGKEKRRVRGRSSGFVGLCQFLSDVG
jgi:hypothetical protein